MTVEESAAKIAEPIIESMGMELVDVEYRREQVGWVLRLYIDKPGGVTLDDCSGVSREVSVAIEVEDILDQRYSLEVSSPGLTRPLKKLSDFERFAGSYAKLKFYGPIEGRKTVVGTIKSVEGEIILFSLDDKEDITLNFGDIAKANLEYKQEG
ncbi:MAG: ribosome maturation factor RimP [Proteobacteria bacterium]|nr:ribosome maturation factor RimP [Pseudomonadota bacterium]